MRSMRFSRVTRKPPPTSPSCRSSTSAVPSPGARAPRAETAYVNREALYDCFPISIWDDPHDDDANIAWTREMWTRMKPYSSGGVYVNNLGDEGEDRVKAAYGENYPRLAALKSKYDPTNIFRLNQNVPPTA